MKTTGSENSPAPGRRTYKPEELIEILGIGRNGVYALIRSGQIRCVRVGRKILVPLSAVNEFLGEASPPLK